MPNSSGRAARPYNVFDPRLIELQKEYARKLMREHVNRIPAWPMPMTRLL
jgi:hypothetical protein